MCTCDDICMLQPSRNQYRWNKYESFRINVIFSQWNFFELFLTTASSDINQLMKIFFSSILEEAKNAEFNKNDISMIVYLPSQNSFSCRSWCYSSMFYLFISNVDWESPPQLFRFSSAKATIPQSFVLINWQSRNGFDTSFHLVTVWFCV